MHNCPPLHAALHQEDCFGHDSLEEFGNWWDAQGRLHFDTADEAEYPLGLCNAYAAALAHALKELDQRTLPTPPSARGAWVHAELGASTQRLADMAAAGDAGEVVCRLLKTMVPGQEVEHLKLLLRFVDHRGAQVRMHLLGDAASTQLIPYPCFGWQWESVQAYAWKHEQHINILEFIALFNYLRSLSNKRHLQHLRLFHVLDTKVVCGVLGKGRSSSRRLNRCCRRLLPLILGMDWYLMPLWTISRWQFSDSASRAWHHEG